MKKYEVFNENEVYQNTSFLTQSEVNHYIYHLGWFVKEVGEEE